MTLRSPPLYAATIRLRPPQQWRRQRQQQRQQQQRFGRRIAYAAATHRNATPPWSRTWRITLPNPHPPKINPAGRPAEARTTSTGHLLEQPPNYSRQQRNGKKAPQQNARREDVKVEQINGTKEMKREKILRDIWVCMCVKSTAAKKIQTEKKYNMMKRVKKGKKQL